MLCFRKLDWSRKTWILWWTSVFIATRGEAERGSNFLWTNYDQTLWRIKNDNSRRCLWCGHVFSIFQARHSMPADGLHWGSYRQCLHLICIKQFIPFWKNWVSKLAAPETPHAPSFSSYTTDNSTTPCPIRPPLNNGNVVYDNGGHLQMCMLIRVKPTWPESYFMHVCMIVHFNHNILVYSLQWMIALALHHSLSTQLWDNFTCWSLLVYKSQNLLYVLLYIHYK